ncbi:type IV pilus modification protein PilV [Salinicola socius]|uniref:type IV pilus modification protein PilV n=1 Tax=Salinicola socius TaxID=404433 RepID=UPI000AC3A0D3|nr:type IV pilus modification protein PilV [Salinicola socius]
MLHSQRGLSLIEVLIAIVVFSVGLLGAARLIVEQHQLEQESGFRATATLMAEDLLERVKLEDADVDRYLGDYEFADAGASPDDDEGVEAPDGLRDWAATWVRRHALPGAKVCSRKVSTGDGTGSEIGVTVVWRSRLEMTPPDDLPTCVSTRDSRQQQRWVELTTWAAAI